jgi:hypothetical protein
MLARYHFRASSCACKNDFVAAAACFVSLPVTKSAHGFASGDVAMQMISQQAQLPDWAPVSDHCPTWVLAREGESKSCRRHSGWRRRPDIKRDGGQSRILDSEQRRRSVLGQSESKQARAKQCQASRGQSQEAVGDKVMIAHDTPSESMLVRID